MTTPSVLVLRAAGTNCERETAFAFEHFGATTETLHVNRVMEDPAVLRRHHVLHVDGTFEGDNQFDVNYAIPSFDRFSIASRTSP